PSTTPASPPRPVRPSSSTRTPTASTPSPTWPTPWRPHAVPGSPRRKSPTPAAGGTSRSCLRDRRRATKSRCPHQLDGAESRVRDDVELDAVALLDRQHGGLARVPG